jgi:hypothetical protein
MGETGPERRERVCGQMGKRPKKRGKGKNRRNIRR